MYEDREIPLVSKQSPPTSKHEDKKYGSESLSFRGSIIGINFQINIKLQKLIMNLK